MRVTACGCCRTDLHVVEGDLELPRLPLIPGHQAVGTIDALGDGCESAQVGDRVGVPWLHHTDGDCEFCVRGEENLCEHADFTGWTVDGGYADALTVPEPFAVRLPESLGDLEAAPLLSAGVIGYRALRRAEVQPGERVALMGFGTSAHLAIQVLRYWGCEAVVMTRGEEHRELARAIGASWVGDAAELRPARATGGRLPPAGELVRVALQVVRPGGTVSLAGIHMSAIPAFDYQVLWRERSLRSVANMTRATRRSSWTSPRRRTSASRTRSIRWRRQPRAGAIATDDVRGAAVLQMD